MVLFSLHLHRLTPSPLVRRYGSWWWLQNLESKYCQDSCSSRISNNQVVSLLLELLQAPCWSSPLADCTSSYQGDNGGHPAIRSPTTSQSLMSTPPTLASHPEQRSP
ncbi:uncharacterized protein LOC124274911 [Haliotis rubra]|uniref:uncharacterized protein LOC124274911 n=1 Tax=Haliotis rubra TaxID=36100 RepID=UPI001EE5C37A|nr:uncharacterized protein LOC124274911 [Haliotis rubra]XP_046566236.1 uncharacterized protein LOC124274911 [Haliotis rubra]XP_046566237.1 uncharacterized protein LOC124274911 [Haliotis rubra]